MEEIYDDVSTTVEPPMIKRNRRELTPGKGNQTKTGFCKVLQTRMYYHLDATLLPSRKNNQGSSVAKLSGKSVMSIFQDVTFRDLGPFVQRADGAIQRRLTKDTALSTGQKIIQWVALSTFQQPRPSRSFFSYFLFISSSEKRKLTEFVIQFIGL